MDALRHDDKLRGALLGLLAGETLGRPADGLDRDQILRRFGRLVNRPDDASAGALTRLLLHGGGAKTPAEALTLAAVAALAGKIQALPEADLDRAEAAIWIGAAVEVAFDEDPYRRLRTDRMLETISARTRAAGTSSLLETLAAQALSPPPPAQALLPFSALPPARFLAASVVHSLVARWRSIEQVVIYAVNLGGEASARGALAGFVAGAHRGGASVPERWTEGLAEAAALRELAGNLVRPHHV